MNNLEEILNRLPDSISYELSLLPEDIIDSLEEIRLRCGQRGSIYFKGQEKLLTKYIDKEDLAYTLDNLIKHSYYAYEEDIAKGFVTISGGHRVGICGKAVIKDGEPTLIKEISSMNIRFAKEIIGCANSIIPKIIQNTLKRRNHCIN